jgi:peptidyl-prolyl cis-trans isomerase SurA
MEVRGLVSVSKTLAVMSLAALTVWAGGCNTKQSADVVATVNGHAILRSELDKRYDDEVGAEQQVKPTPEQADASRLGLLDERLIPEEILVQRAAKMSVTATPEEVDDKLKEMKAPYSEEQFNQRLAERHLAMEDLKREVQRNLTINKLVHKEIDSKITVADSDIASYFALHKSEFNNVNTLFHLAQILVTTAPNPRVGNLQGSKATTEAEARKKIQALRTRWESGEDFGSLAMNFSENPQTSSSGGDMGMVAEPDLQQNGTVFAAISKLKAGQVTDIIPFPDPQDPKKVGGFAIFQLISKDPAGQHDIAEPQIQQKIRQGLHDNRSQLLKGAYFEMLRDQSKVQNFFAEQIFKSDAH